MVAPSGLKAMPLTQLVKPVIGSLDRVPVSASQKLTAASAPAEARMTVRAECHVQDSTVGGERRSCGGTAGGVPEPKGLVVPTRDQSTSLAERNGVDHTLVTGECAEGRTTRHVPQLNDTVGAGCGEDLAVGAEGHVDLSGRRRKRSLERSSGERIPEPNGAVVTGEGQECRLRRRPRR